MAKAKYLEELEGWATLLQTTFVIGYRGCGSGAWFAHCDGVEWDGATPQAAVKSVVNELAHEWTRRHLEAAAVLAKGKFPPLETSAAWGD